MTRTFNLVWKTALISLLALAVFLALSLAWNFMLKAVFWIFGLPEDWLQFPIIWVVILALLFVPKRLFRLNFPIVFKRSAIINAPLDKVWDELAPSARNDYYLASIDRIEADPSNGRQFVLHMDKALTQQTDGQPIEVRIELQSCTPHSYLDYICLHDENTIEKVRFATRSERHLEQTPDGVHVTVVEHTKGIGLFMALMFLLRNPCKDALKQLKARCEGTPDTSWASEMMDKLKVEANGGPKASMDGDIMIIGATAVATWGSAAALLIWYALRLSAST